MLVMLWIFLCVVVGFLGRKTRLGFWGNLILGLFLSPLISLVVVFMTSKVTGNIHIEEFKEDMSSSNTKKKGFDFTRPVSEEDLMEGFEDLNSKA